MAAVLAVALLLLCGNVQSEEAPRAFVTQVKSGEYNNSSTAPAMAPAITSPTVGSGDTHTAVLSALTQLDESKPALVDLARADDEKMRSMTSAPAPSPSGEALPEGFDMVEAEGPSTEEEAPGPDAVDPAAPSPESAYSLASEEHGILVSDVDDNSYPNISEDEINKYKEGRGGRTTPYDADTRFSTYGSDSADSGGHEGILVSDVDDNSYPNLTGNEVNDYKEGHGVQTTPYDADSRFSTYGFDSADSEGHEGTLVSDVDDNSYPNLTGNEVNDYKEGHGVQTTPYDADTRFSTYGRDPADSDGHEGILVSDVDDNSYPNITGAEDFSNGEGYGVNNSPDKEDKGTTQDEAGSESGISESKGFALSQSRTYTPPPKSKKASWGKGKCTFYGGMDAAGTMSGACGYGNLYASGYGAYTAALSSALFKNGMTCGACYEVACSGNAKSCKPGSVLVTVTNFCPPNPANSGGWCNGANQHFDLSYPAFAKIADPKAGVVDLDYRRVPCKKKGGIRFTLNGNCNFNLVTITNVGGSGVVTEAYMKGDGMDWAPMSRNWGANWQCSRNYCGKGISIKIVTSDKKISVSRLAGKDWAFGKTYIGQQVY